MSIYWAQLFELNPNDRKESHTVAVEFEYEHDPATRTSLGRGLYQQAHEAALEQGLYRWPKTQEVPSCKEVSLTEVFPGPDPFGARANSEGKGGG